MIYKDFDVYKDFDAALKLLSSVHEMIPIFDGNLDIIEESSKFNQVRITYTPSLFHHLYAVNGIQKAPVFQFNGSCERKEFNVWKKHPDGLFYFNKNGSNQIIALEMKDNILSYFKEVFAQIASGLCNMKLLEYMCVGNTLQNAECVGILIGTKTEKAEAYILKKIDEREKTGRELKVSERLYREKKATTTIGRLNIDKDIPAHLSSFPVSLHLELCNVDENQTTISLPSLLNK